MAEGKQAYLGKVSERRLIMAGRCGGSVDFAGTKPAAALRRCYTNRTEPAARSTHVVSARLPPPAASSVLSCFWPASPVPCPVVARFGPLLHTLRHPRSPPGRRRSSPLHPPSTCLLGVDRFALSRPRCASPILLRLAGARRETSRPRSHDGRRVPLELTRRPSPGQLQ